MKQSVTISAIIFTLAAGFVFFTHEPSPQTAAQAIAADQQTYRQLNLLGDIFERVRSGYVEEPEDKELINAAINGMLTSLDPHSSYLDADGYQDMIAHTSGEFGGLGIEVTMKDGVVHVVSPIDDTPAQRAGIRAGDKITRLDGNPITGITLFEAVKQMRGPIDSKLVLTVVREGVSKPFEVEIIRDLIRIQPVKYEANNNVGYIRITTFNEHTTDDLHEALDTLSQEIGQDNLAGYVLDLRNNPGGLLSEAVAVSDTFLEHGEIVSTRGREPQDIQRFNAREGDLADGTPVIVLINGGSASASEIVAGALQDHRRATVLGTRSFGKGSVQTIIPLGEDGAIRLTTARYYTPSGQAIQARGVEPDIEIKPILEDGEEPDIASETELRGYLKAEDEEEDEASVSGSSYYIPEDKEKDVQINYAMELLRGVHAHRLEAAETAPVSGVN